MDSTDRVATGRRARGAAPVRATATGSAVPAARATSVRPVPAVLGASRVRATTVARSLPTAAVRGSSRVRATRLVRGSGSATDPASIPVQARRAATALGVPVGGTRALEPHATQAASGVREAATDPVVLRVRQARAPPGRASGRVDQSIARSPGPGRFDRLIGRRATVRTAARPPARSPGPGRTAARPPARSPGPGRTVARPPARSPGPGRTAARPPARSPGPGRTVARPPARSPRSPALPARPRSRRSPGLSPPLRVHGSRPARAPVARPPTAHARVGPGPGRGARTRGTDRTTRDAPSR